LPLRALVLAEGLKPVADVFTNPLGALGMRCPTITLTRITPAAELGKRQPIATEPDIVCRKPDRAAKPF
jgi:hypothetical protein